MFAGLSPNDLSPEGKMALACIALGFVAALVILGKAWMRLRQEQGTLKRVQSARAPTTMENAEALLTQSGDGEITRVLRVALNTGKVETDTLPFLDWVQGARYLAGIFVFLGLLGTVAGISMAISHLGGTLGAGPGATGSSHVSSTEETQFIFTQSNNLLSSIGGLLGGIKSACVCTFWGIFATIALSLLNTFYTTKCQALETVIVRFAQDGLLGLRAKAQDETGLRIALSNAVTLLEGASRRLSEAAENLMGSVTVGSQKIAEATDQSAEMADRVGRLTGEAVVLSERINAASQAMQVSVQIISEERTGLNGMSDTVGLAATKMGQEIRQLRESLAEAQEKGSEADRLLVSGIEETHRSLRDLLRRFEGILNDVMSAQNANRTSDSQPLRRELLSIKTDLLEEVRRVEQRLSTDLTRTRQEPSYAATPSLYQMDGDGEPIRSPISSNSAGAFDPDNDFAGPPDRRSATSVNPPIVITRPASAPVRVGPITRLRDFLTRRGKKRP